MNIRIRKKYLKREGREIFILDYYGPDGRRYRERAGSTEKMADLAKARLLAQIDRGEWRKVKPMTFSTFLEKAYKPQHVEVRMKDPYKAKSTLRTLEGYFGAMLLTQIGVNQVEAYQRQRIQDGVTPATVNREVGRLRHAINWAIDRGLANEQPVRRRMMLRETGARHPEILSPEFFSSLLTALPTHLRPIASLAYHTGMRRGEILGLTWDRVDLRGGFLTLTGTKTGEDRAVPIPAPLLPQLRRLKAQGLRGGLDVRGGHVFTVPAAKGTGHRPGASERPPRAARPVGQFDKAWKTACKAVGLQGFRFHDLRHNFVSRAQAAGLPPHQVRAISGHKTDSMLRRYSHVTPDGLRAAMRRLEESDTEWTQIERARNKASGDDGENP